MAEQVTTQQQAQAHSVVLNGFAVAILKEMLGILLQMGEGPAEKAVARNLGRQHSLPPNASDADKDAFCRHATRQFAKVTVKSGFLADRFRDFEGPRIVATVKGQLPTGATTEQGVHVIGQAIIADVQALVNAVPVP